MQRSFRHLGMALFCFLSYFPSLYGKEKGGPLQKLEQLEREGAKVSALFVSLPTGKTIASLNPELLVTPASVSKLVISGKVLETWGPDKTFLSQIYRRGTLSSDKIKGDLVFYGGGDPYLTNEKLWFLTTDVARAGVKKVEGSLIINNSLFGPLLPDISRNRVQKSSANAYDSPLSSAAVNFSVLAIVVNPASEAGKKAMVSIEPYELPSVKVVNQVTTGAETKITVTRKTQNDIDVFTVTGTIAPNAVGQRIYRSISNPERYAGEVITAFLKAAGVEIKGDIRFESTPLRSNDVLLSEIEGFPLDFQMRGLNNMSNNFIADTLTLHLMTENKMRDEKYTLESAGVLLEDYMHSVAKECPLTSPIAPKADSVLKSGSGLSVASRLSAHQVVCLLERMYAQNREFPAFWSTLPYPTAPGTLKKRFSAVNERHLETDLRAKTGTLTQPVDVTSLAGYIRRKKGDLIAFTIMVNGSEKKSHFGVERIRAAIDADLASLFPLEL